jgi:hypothetical protein
LQVAEIDEKFTIAKVRSGTGFRVGDMVKMKK